MQAKDRIGERFELIRSVGSGAYGTVYLARDRRLDTEVALKLLHAESESADDRFEREAAVLSRLEHPAIVRYLAGGRDSDGKLYLAMEWLEGETLERRLQDGALSIPEVLALARCLVGALEAAERAAIVHRDLKPANIMLVGGEATQAKLLDFGLARTHEGASSITRSGVVVGTPQYMSPEQARGRGELTTATDVFSLGSVLYECLTGAAAFDAANMLAVMARICLEEPERVERLRPEAPPSLARVLRLMLSKNAALRPRPSALLEALSADAEPSPSQAQATVQLSGTLELQVPESQPPSAFDGASQRVICVLLLGGELTGGEGEGSGEREAELAALLEARELSAERLRGGTRVVLLDANLGASEQALTAARCALDLHRAFDRVPIVLCMGRALAGGRLPLGEVFERGAELLECTAPGVVRVDQASAGLLDRRFSLVPDDAAFALVDEKTDEGAPRALLGAAVPFVGREMELTQLQAVFWGCLEEGVSRAALVTAPPGAGKSRLGREWRERLEASGTPFTLIQVRADLNQRDAMYGVIVDALRVWCDLDPRDGLDRAREQLRGRLAAYLSDDRVRETVSLLREALMARGRDAERAEGSGEPRDPQAQAERLERGLTAWLEALCAKEPVLLLIDDLHWADAASVRVIDRALGSCANNLTVVALARPEVHEAHPGLWSTRELTEIRLSRLGIKASERLLASLADDALAESVRAWAIERAEGNPLYLEELARVLRGRGDLTLPDSILGLIQARLDALDPASLRVVQASSIFGQSVPCEALAALLGGDGAPTSELASQLRLLRESEVLVAAAGDPFGDGSELRFRHALFRDAAYALMPPAQCTAWHRSAAEWFDREGGLGAAALAEHFERGEQPGRAAPLYLRATAQALEAIAYDNAVRLGQRALECGLDGPGQAEAKSLIAEAMSYAGKHDQAEPWAEQAWQQSDPSQAAWWRAAMVLVASYGNRGDERGAAVLERMIEHADPAHLGLEQAVALGLAAGNAQIFGEGALGRRIMGLVSREQLTPLGPRAESSFETARSVTAFAAGDLETASEHARRTIQILREGGVDRDQMTILSALTFFLSELGDYEEAERVAEECLVMQRRVGDECGLFTGSMMLGLVKLRRGLLQEALELAVRSAEGFAQLGSSHEAAFASTYAAWALLAAGDPAGALPHLKEALERRDEAPLARPIALAVRAGALLASGRPAEALPDAERAMALLEREESIEHEGLIRANHAEALIACGKVDEGRAALAAAGRWLDARAAKIRDPSRRQVFETQIDEHARIRALAARWGTEP